MYDTNYKQLQKIRTFLHIRYCSFRVGKKIFSRLYLNDWFHVNSSLVIGYLYTCSFYRCIYPLICEDLWNPCLFFRIVYNFHIKLKVFKVFKLNNYFDNPLSERVWDYYNFVSLRGYLPLKPLWLFFLYLDGGLGC